MILKVWSDAVVLNPDEYYNHWPPLKKDQHPGTIPDQLNMTEGGGWSIDECFNNNQMIPKCNGVECTESVREPQRSNYIKRPKIKIKKEKRNKRKKKSH